MTPGTKRAHRNAVDAYCRALRRLNLNSGFERLGKKIGFSSANTCARDVPTPEELTSSLAQPARQDLAERAAFFAVILT